MRWMVLCAAMAAVVGGCVTTQPGAGSIVFTGNADLVKGCRFLEQATGNQFLIGGILLMGAAKEDTVRQLRERAIAIGGTHVITLNTQMGMGGASATGDIYRCG